MISLGGMAMNCMKCGRETAGEQVFCTECLLEMEKHPVKPGTVVLLPRRRETIQVKKPSKRRSLSTEEQLRSLRRWVKGLTIALCICITLILAMLYPTIHYLNHDHFEIGQNYNTVVTPSAPPAEN